MTQQAYPRGEVSRRGKEIYERSIRATVEKDHWGEYLVIDIETGDYVIAKDYLTASNRAYQKRPDGIRYAMKIGSPAIGRMGFNVRSAKI